MCAVWLEGKGRLSSRTVRPAEIQKSPMSSGVWVWTHFSLVVTGYTRQAARAYGADAAECGQHGYGRHGSKHAEPERWGS